MTVPGPRFDGKPFLSQHGRRIGWGCAGVDALHPGQKGSERQSGVVLAMGVPPAEPPGGSEAPK